MTATLAAKDLPCLVATAAPTGLFLLDAAGDATYVNPRLAEILGAPIDVLLGSELVARLLGEAFVGDFERIRAALAIGEDGQSGESTHEPKSAQGVSAVRVLAARSRDAAGIVGVVEDVTRVRSAAEIAKRTEQSRERARRLEALGVLAGGIAHDINNLLVGIVGNATLAELDIAPDGDAAEALADLRLSAQRATDLTGQLLAFGGRSAAAPQSVDAVAAIEDALGAPAFAPTRSRIVRECAPVVPRVMCDPARLRLLVTHLVSNAVEALPESGGCVTVRTRVIAVDAARIVALAFDGGLKEGSHVAIEVEDIGIGMSAAALDRAFEPFVTTKTKRRGLGLAIVAGTARIYKLGIEAMSTEGTGTTIRVLFPIDPSQPAVATPAENHVVPHAPEAILVVDDESAVRDVTRRLLARQGFDVLEASSGEEALRVLVDARGRVRCVLLDHSMPGMDGAETFRRMREVMPDVRVVMTSGYNERDLRAKFDDTGLAGYLQKPFDLAALLRAARAAIAA